MSGEDDNAENIDEVDANDEETETWRVAKWQLSIESFIPLGWWGFWQNGNSHIFTNKDAAQVLDDLITAVGRQRLGLESWVAWKKPKEKSLQ